MSFHYVVALRYLHILCAVFWGGFVLFYGLILEPNARRRMAPKAYDAFMNALFPISSWVFSVLALLTLLTGIALLELVIGGFSHLFDSRKGEAVALALACVFVCFLNGAFVLPRLLRKYRQSIGTGEEMPATPEVASAAGWVGFSAKLNALLVVVAAIAMASLSYRTIEIIRTVHIVAAIFWAGTTIYFGFFFEPIFRKLVPRSYEALMKALFPHAPLMMMGLFFIVFATGLTLISMTTGFSHFDALFHTNHGRAILISGFFSICMVTTGTFLESPITRARLALLEAMPNPATAEWTASYEAAGKRMALYSRLNTLFAIAATSGMALQRFL